MLFEDGNLALQIQDLLILLDALVLKLLLVDVQVEHDHEEGPQSLPRHVDVVQAFEAWRLNSVNIECLDLRIQSCDLTRHVVQVLIDGVQSLRD